MSETEFDWSQLRLLVVEEDPATLQRLTAIFDSVALKAVEYVTNTDDAIAALARMSPHLVLIEANADGADSLELLRRIRNPKTSASPNVLVSVMVAMADAEQLRRMCGIGIESFVRKPVTRDVLLPRLVKMIRDPRRFVSSLQYFGPDRRRPRSPGDPYRGVERRRPSKSERDTSRAASVVLSREARAAAGTDAPPASTAPAAPPDAPAPPTPSPPPPKPAPEAAPPAPEPTRPSPPKAPQRPAASKTSGWSDEELGAADDSSPTGDDFDRGSPASPRAPDRLQTAQKPAPAPSPRAPAPSPRAPAPMAPPPPKQPAPPTEKPPPPPPAAAAPPQPKDSGPDHHAIVASHMEWLETRGRSGAKASLEGENLAGIDLAGVNLSSANLRKADLSGANLRAATLQSTDLRAADLSGADLRESDLATANMRRADLSVSQLGDASFVGADLAGASLRGADLTATNLQGVNLLDTDLFSTDLSKVGGLVQPQINKARVNGETVLPPGFRLPAHEE